ncbi:MAG TPA: hypothetical protein VFT43_00295 [Candidatus Polarisedimenticolia bacterium]|nr:hypothetical protein [Candidatus Polarisedimenticolia bacterium]
MRREWIVACLSAFFLPAFAALGCDARPGGAPEGMAGLLVSNRSGTFRIYEAGLEKGAAGAPGWAETWARPIGGAGAAARGYGDTMPARLPDGRVVFVSDRDGNPEIYVTSPDDGTVRRLTHDPDDPALAASDSAPAALGRDRIVFARTGPGAPPGAPRDLYVMAVDGSGLRRLTRHPADDAAPSGSPDGRAVAFVSTRSGAARIHLLPDVDLPDPEAARTSLSGSAVPGSIWADPGVTFSDNAPAFLPDGSIVFSRRPTGEVAHLFQMDRAGGRDGLRQITDWVTLPFGGDEPVILPDGAILLVSGPIPPPEGKEGPVRFAAYRIEAGGFNLSRVTRAGAAYDDFARRLAGD